jgi:hypothetical protein
MIIANAFHAILLRLACLKKKGDLRRLTWIQSSASSRMQHIGRSN